MEENPVVVHLVIDAVGISTLEYLLDKSDIDVRFPNLESMGLGNLLDKRHHTRVQPVQDPAFAYALEQASAEADSVIGHREMVGVVDPRTYELFFNGFPPQYIAELERRIGIRTIFNQMAGGDEAIKINREEHETTGKSIVYASMCDPLIQIAMNEDVIPVPDAHRIGDIAFDLAIQMGIPITRSITRTYIVRDEEIIRTANRHDKVLPLDGKTLVDVLHDAGVYVISVGKPAELVPSGSWNEVIKLSQRSQLDPQIGLKFVHPKEKDTNPYTLQGMVNALRASRSSTSRRGTYIFANCVDTDSVYGHTQMVPGSLRSVGEVDRCLPIILREMQSGDVLLITADHGMLHAGDREYHKDLEGTKFQNYGYHHKEPVPFLGFRKDGNLGQIVVPTTNTFGIVGYVVAQLMGVSSKYLNACSQVSKLIRQ